MSENVTSMQNAAATADTDKETNGLLELISRLWEAIQRWFHDATAEAEIRTKLDKIEADLRELNRLSKLDNRAFKEMAQNLRVCLNEAISGAESRDSERCSLGLTAAIDVLTEAKNASADRQGTVLNFTEDSKALLASYGKIHNVYQRGAEVIIDAESGAKRLVLEQTGASKDGRPVYTYVVTDLKERVEDVVSEDGWTDWRQDGNARAFWDGMEALDDLGAFGLDQTDQYFRNRIIDNISQDVERLYGKYKPLKLNEEAQIEESSVYEDKEMTYTGSGSLASFVIEDSDSLADSLRLSYDETTNEVIGTYMEPGGDGSVVFTVSTREDGGMFSINLPNPWFAEKWILHNPVLQGYLLAAGVNRDVFCKKIEEAIATPGFNLFAKVPESEYAHLEELEVALQRQYKNDIEFVAQKDLAVERQGFDAPFRCTYLRIKEHSTGNSFFIGFGPDLTPLKICKQENGHFVEVPSKNSTLFALVRDTQAQLRAEREAKEQRQSQQRTGNARTASTPARG